MLKPLILAAVLLGQVSAPLPPRVNPGGPMIPAPPGFSEGITVNGAAYVTAPASEARVTLRVFARNNALTLNAQTLQPVVDALTRAGAERSSVSLPPYLVGQARTNSAVVTARVHQPTPAMLQQGMLTIASAFAANPGILLNTADVQLDAENCAALQRNAEAKAIANARANAAFLAKEIGKRVGGVLALDARGVAVNPQGTCGFSYSIGPYGSPFAQQSVADLMTVKVYANVTMRFAIR